MKTKVLALLLSVAVTFSGIPAMNVSAAPVSFETVVEETMVAEETTVEEATVAEETTVEETTVAEETTVEETAVAEETIVEETTVAEEMTVEETTVAEETTVEETVAAEEVRVSEVSENSKDANIKAVGSNGKIYQDVVYLSKGTVNSLPADAQTVYYEMCDTIAQLYEDGVVLRDVVISANDEALKINYTMPVRTLISNVKQNSAGVQEAVVSGEVEDEDSYSEFNTLIKDGNYFRNQLNANAKKVYDAGKKSIVQGGSNSITVTYNGRHNIYYEDADGISALVNAYPNKFNWMDLGPNGGVSASGTYYYATGTSVWKFVLAKSKHYSSSLEQDAKAKVIQLVNAAYEYAEEKYPTQTTYGIIKYFNDWICTNNYYEDKGIDPETYGRRAEYFYCHSCYGILLKGYGVCESYALAMTRLLDAAGIRNLYVVGDTPGGGHAWNYVEMPDGQWYLLDSTWNDSDDDDVSLRDDYLLVEDDGYHYATGKRFTVGNEFSYYPLSDSSYLASEEPFNINFSKLYLNVGESVNLGVDTDANGRNDYYDSFKKIWVSSDPAVVSVSDNGKVKAKKPGVAVVTCEMAGRKVSCAVRVYKFTGLKFTENNKNAYTFNYANPDVIFSESDVQTITLNVGKQAGTVPAEEVMMNIGMILDATSNKKNIVDVKDVSISGDTISVKILPKDIGTAKIKVTFGQNMKATLTVKVTQGVQESWFDYTNVVDKEYTGNAIKPGVTLTAEGKSSTPKLTYKVSYKNNKEVGTATVIIKGTGQYGGQVEKTFEITPKDITSAKFKACTASKTYNTKARPASTTVVIGGKTLKAGKDYDVYYNDSLSVPVNAGKYVVKIVGKGNYTGTVAVTKTYQIKPAKITDVKVTCEKTVKWTGSEVVPKYTVKLGGVEVPETDYFVAYEPASGGISSFPPSEVGKHTLVVIPRGENIITTAKVENIKVKYTIKY